ncbi:MAG: MMPL family transporter [Myxococcales bacterium]|nr:MMPL family transporter [Polyangiaceae bacterium]MDW8248171.1 MMPL family transporter [Myxococcales bacterium]
MRHRFPILLLMVLTALAGWVVATCVRLSPDLAPLLPDQGSGVALATFVRAFHGGDPGLVLLEGDDPAEVHQAALHLSTALIPLFPASTRLALEEQSLTPGRLLLLADDPLRRDLVAFLEPSALRARLAETRALLLAPGSAVLAPALARDPLRFGQVVAERRAPGARGRGDGELVSPDGRARLVIVEPPGSALHSEEARSFVRQVEAVIQRTQAEFPKVRVRLTGGPSLAVATEDLLRSDLTRSGLLALFLASAVFVGLQRRPRALLSVLPPLVAGSLLASAVGAVFSGGIAGVAVAFVSVVLGVGMDSGVHVHAAVCEAVARGVTSPAQEALARVIRPVLGAALVAGSAFACLALSRVEALRQLGLLAAAGEVATALWICAFSPWASGWLERRAGGLPPPPRWAFSLVRLSRHRLTRSVSLVAGVALLVMLFWTGGPDRSGGLLLIRPEGLAPQQVYRDIAARFDQLDRPPWVVLVRDVDEEAARTRADRLVEVLLGHPEVTGTMDSLTSWAPARTTLERRREALRALDLPRRAADLEAALQELRFQPDRFREVLEELARPTDPPTPDVLRRRFIGRDGARTVVQIETRAPDPEALTALVHSVDPAANVTGWGALEPTLREALAGDLGRVGGWAAALLVASLTLVVRRPRDVILAAAVVVMELVVVLVGMRALGIPLHLYDALVLPVLLGVTADEVLFVLWAVRRGEDVEDALVRETPVVAATALTTATGFSSLLVCSFPPLRHLGAVAALGSAVGVVLALLVVPAWARSAHSARSVSS